MRSFSEYRKIQLKESIKEVCLREKVSGHFEMLRLDLIDKIKLPHVLSEDINPLAVREYERFREDDFNQTRQFVEDVIRVCKKDFYNELLMEAESAGSAPYGNLDTFKSALVMKVKEMLSDLRANVESIVSPAGGPSDTGTDGVGSDASSGVPSSAGSGASSGVPNSAGSGASSGVPNSAGSGASSGVPNSAGGVTGEAPTSATGPASAFAANPSVPKSANDYPSWGQGKGDERRTQAGGYTPAPMGSFSPSDGISGGLGRLARRVTRPLRRIWHGDKNREMAKGMRSYMKRETVEPIILENWDRINQLLGDFETNILGFIDTEFAKIGVEAGVGGGVGGDVGDGEMGNPTTGAMPMHPGDENLAAAGSDVAEMGTPSGGSRRSQVMARNKAAKEARTKAAEALGTTKALTKSGRTSHSMNLKNVIAALNEKGGEIPLDPSLTRLVGMYGMAPSSTKIEGKTDKKQIIQQIAQHLGVAPNSQHQITSALLEAAGKALGAEIPELSPEEVTGPMATVDPGVAASGTPGTMEPPTAPDLTGPDSGGATDPALQSGEPDPSQTQAGVEDPASVKQQLQQAGMWDKWVNAMVASGEMQPDQADETLAIVVDNGWDFQSIMDNLSQVEQPQAQAPQAPAPQAPAPQAEQPQAPAPSGGDDWDSLGSMDLGGGGSEFDSEGPNSLQENPEFESALERVSTAIDLDDNIDETIMRDLMDALRAKAEDDAGKFGVPMAMDTLKRYADYAENGDLRSVIEDLTQEGFYGDDGMGDHAPDEYEDTGEDDPYMNRESFTNKVGRLKKMLHENSKMKPGKVKKLMLS